MSHREIALTLHSHAREVARTAMTKNMLDTALVTQADDDAVVLALNESDLEIDDGDTRWNVHVDPASLQVGDEVVVAHISGEYYVLARLALGSEDESFADDFGDGSSTSFLINHGLHSRDLIVQFRYNAGGAHPYQSFQATWTATDLDHITVSAGGPLGVDAARVMIQSV